VGPEFRIWGKGAGEGARRGAEMLGEPGEKGGLGAKDKRKVRLSGSWEEPRKTLIELLAEQHRRKLSRDACSWPGRSSKISLSHRA